MQKIKLAYSVERIAYREKLSAKRYPLNAKNYLIIIVLLFGIISNAYALNLDNLKADFLSGDYKSAIAEGEKILADTSAHEGLDELYYFLGLSYLKEGNILRASDIFEIIINEFKDSNFREEAKLALGDTYFLKGDYALAQEYYNGLLGGIKKEELLPALYSRLGQCAAELGDIKLAQEYMDKLKREFPLSPETGISKLPAVTSLYYTVQVGSFLNKGNAKSLAAKLNQKKYYAYVEEAKSEGKLIYRVKVGKTNSRQEAQEIEKTLANEGYPTKIIP